MKPAMGKVWRALRRCDRSCSVGANAWQRGLCAAPAVDDRARRPARARIPGGRVSRGAATLLTTCGYSMRAVKRCRSASCPRRRCSRVTLRRSTYVGVAACCRRSARVAAACVCAKRGARSATAQWSNSDRRRRHRRNGTGRSERGNFGPRCRRLSDRCAGLERFKGPAGAGLCTGCSGLRRKGRSPGKRGSGYLAAYRVGSVDAEPQARRTDRAQLLRARSAAGVHSRGLGV